MSGTIESIALEHCRAWSERAALLKKRRALVCEYEEWDSDHPSQSTDACWAGGRAYCGPAMEELHDEWCEPCQQSRDLTVEINKLTRKVVGTRTRMLNAARRTP